jgi:uncharacterized protein (DUF885 family)
MTLSCARVLLLCCLVGDRPAWALPGEKTESTMTHPASTGVDDAALSALLEQHWESMMERWPTWATKLGDHRFDDRLADNTPEAAERSRAGVAEWLARTKAIDPGGLTARDQVTWQALHHEFSTAKDKAACRTEQWAVSPMGNTFSSLNHLGALHPLRTAEDGANLIARYRAVPAYVDGAIDSLQLGRTAGRLPNQESLRRTIEIIDAELARPEAEWALMQPATAALSDWSTAEKMGFVQGLTAAVRAHIRPSYTRYRDFLRDVLMPDSRGPDRAGVRWLPEGEACYAAAIKEHTTLSMSADEIHAAGIAELGAIHGEFRRLGERLWGEADLGAIFKRLRTDERLYFDTPEAVQAKAEEALARAAAAVPDWFGTLPMTPCVVVPIPDFEARYATIAYYRPPHTDGSKPGEYFINTWAPQTRPRHEAEVLAFHESIPGHHTQIALAQEQDALPLFRRHIRPNAYIEGWALYTERLADEMGLYTSDLDRMGMLSFDAWRASRLVVDTGLHARGWTRKQAMAFMEDNTPLARNNIDNEVDRYISWPGQALSYKLGQLEIRRLRQEAEQRLGERFELPAFHDAVLQLGAVPLPVLRVHIEQWIVQKAAQPLGDPAPRRRR